MNEYVCTTEIFFWLILATISGTLLIRSVVMEIIERFRRCANCGGTLTMEEKDSCICHLLIKHKLVKKSK